MIALVLLAACTRDPGPTPAALPADCATFDEMVLTDPDGVASDNDFARVRYVVDELAASAPIDGVCVPELRFDESGACGVDQNCYQGPNEPILVGSSSVSEVREVMCEALADHLDYADLAPELFPTPESFVRACAEFPASLTLQASTDGTCAAGTVEASRAQAAALMETVFPHWEVPLGDPVDVTLERHGVTGLEGDLGSFFASGGVFYAWESGVDEDAGSVVRIDPDTFTVTGRYPIPERPQDRITRLVPTDTTPILVVASESEGVQSWRLEDDAWVSTSFAAFGNADPFYGAADADTAWVLGYPTSTTAALESIDLTTGERALLAGPEVRSAISLFGDGAFLVGSAEVAILEPVALLVDPVAATYEAVPVPYDWHVTYPVGLGEDVVGVWGVNDLASLVVYDTDAGTWHLASDPCGDARVEGGAYPASLDVLFVEPRLAAAAPGGAWMTRVLVGG